MRWFVEHLHRLYALSFLIAMALIFTHLIGETGSCEQITWKGAWASVMLITAAMFAGFMAGRESKQ